MHQTLLNAIAEIQRLYPAQPAQSLLRTLAGLLLGTVLLGAVFYVLERLFPERPGQPALRPGLGTGSIYWFFDFFVAKRLATAIAFRMPRLTLVARQPLWQQAIETLFVADFFGYWSHRMLHEIPWLWRIHRVHHSSERIDWLAAARVHPLEGVWTKMISILPLFLLGFSPKVTAVLTPFIAFYPDLHPLQRPVRLRTAGLRDCQPRISPLAPCLRR